MLVNELRVPVAAEQDAEVVEPSHDTLKLDAIDEKDRQRDLVLAAMVQERVLEVLSALARQFFLSLFRDRNRGSVGPVP